MLRQVYIIRKKNIIYSIKYAKALSEAEFKNIVPDIISDAFSRLGSESGTYNYYKYKIIFTAEKDLGILFIFMSDLSDDPSRLQTELLRLKKEYFNLFEHSIEDIQDYSVLDVLDSIIDGIHRNLKPKISLVGFSGVGKTTITRLIKAEEIPLEHLPTINGDVATIKIGKLTFLLWDFAGQEQFSLLWNRFIKGSDAVLLITNSTLENVEKSKFFLELIKEEAPYAHSAIIGNKQDLPNALSTEDIERIMGVKTYSMVAIDPKNREKMMHIIADILDMSAEVSPLLKPIIERDILTNNAQTALLNGDFEQAGSYFEKIADLCIEIGDDTLGKEFYEKSKKLRSVLNQA